MCPCAKAALGVIRRRADTTMAKRKGTNNDLQNIAHTTKDRAIVFS